MNVVFLPLDVERDWHWVTKELPVALCEGVKGIVAVDTDTNAPVGVAVMDSWTYTTVQVHFAVMRPMVLKHGFLEEIADYVFNVCSKIKMIGLVPADNEKALKLDKHIGFKELYRLKDGYDFGVDYVIMELTRADAARWLNETIAEQHHG